MCVDILPFAWEWELVGARPHPISPLEQVGSLDFEMVGNGNKME